MGLTTGKSLGDRREHGAHGCVGVRFGQGSPRRYVSREFALVHSGSPRGPVRVSVSRCRGPSGRAPRRAWIGAAVLLAATLTFDSSENRGYLPVSEGEQVSRALLFGGRQTRGVKKPALIPDAAQG